MADRFTLKLFAGELDADNKIPTGQYGSFVAQGGVIGVSGVLTNNPTTLQALPAWSTGWKTASASANKLPRAEEFNAVSYVITKFVLYNWNDGITYWSEDLTPTANQTIVQYQTSTNAPCIYYNTTGTNTSTAPDSDTTNWHLSFDLSKDYVDTTTSQSIVSGTKTFGDNARLVLEDGAANNFHLKNNTLVSNLSNTGNYGVLSFIDKDGKNVGYITEYQTPSDSSGHTVRLMNMTLMQNDGVTEAGSLSLNDIQGNTPYGSPAVVALCPTPPDNAKKTEITTAEWVRQNILPDYSSGVAQSIGTSYTATKSGYITFTQSQTHDDVNYELVITYNGATVSFNFGSFSTVVDNNLDTIIFPIQAGASYYINVSYGTTTSYRMIFFPQIGA